MRRFASTWAFAWATSFFLVVCGPNVFNHPAARAADEVDEELARQQAIIDRFLTVLEKNPRRGTALDRIYGFYVENGQINELVAKYAERAKQDEADGVSWMIIGLVESQRGRDAAAVEAFRRATEIRTDDALAPYYLGQSLVLVGQPDEAVKAFELAISRKPPPNDLLPVFQALGRVHQRAQRSEEALKVWTRLEELFPGDVLVKEQIAATMVEEGQFADALSRYQSLATLTKDDYRRSVYQIEAADLLVKLNRGSEGVAMLEALLASLNPDGWLHRDVRRRIEDIFLRTEDTGGLAKYYEGWLEKNPEDVDAMARLARVLAPPTRPLGDPLVLPGLGWAAGPAARGGTPGSLRSGGRVQHLASHGGRDAKRSLPPLAELRRLCSAPPHRQDPPELHGQRDPCRHPGRLRSAVPR